ncbi:restriction endonuclease subunit S [Vibrio aestuarianus]|uniref:restriction endonuclease subunit S n=1 Tax=Vibrio aestuarianus TaxID=28171 RepID=UPI00237CD165|nr:restriction endonuclease subunit S [Vibrio aestuarianus]MDE1271028.1 restriction endonuclease subunit S [Vibrio aestuarianus]MDH5892373.1 restriction endonuclease subunit S [Vibrio aestuarianus]WDS56184.1 restriction endonuclease subunit S [Vibrio aestuarianus]WDS59811.1 restriction endonuclease subunit S [Vibrio aestuarianus]
MTGRYKAYPEYKSSGVEWLEAIPLSWQIMKVKFLLKNGAEGIKIGPFGSALKLEDMVSKGIKVYGQENVIKRNFTLGKRFISQEKHIDMKVYTVEKGDILITMMGTSGKCQVVPEDAERGIIDSHLLKLRTNYKILPELFRLLVDEAKEVKDQIGKQGKGSIMHGLNSTIVKELEFPLPSLKEQTKILNFLDHETAKIDTLITKQEKLIDLLKEKRQAVISHAVTKGLNPDAPMKDSGVEWLGEVPEHWEFKRFKHLFKIRKRIAGKTGYDILSITQKGIKVKDITSGDGQLSMDYSKYQLVYQGDYAMNHMDLLTGFVDISKYDGVTSPDYRVFTLEHEHSSTEYYLNILQMGYLDKLFYPLGQGAAHIGRWRLPTEAFNEFLVPCPPNEEQEDITKFISLTFSKVDNLLDKAVYAISLMKERKTALISAAVTGKIDVRDWQGEA